MDPVIMGAFHAAQAIKKGADARELKQRMKDIYAGVRAVGATLDSDKPIELSAERLEADEVRALGHYGNFYYFLIQGEERQALVQAYTCASKFPVLAMQLFPRSLFTVDYLERWRENASERQQLQMDYALGVRSYKADLARFYGGWAWKVGKVAGIAVASLAAGAVSPPAAGRGLAFAAMQLVTTENPYPHMPKPTTVLIDRNDAKTGRLLRDLSREADERLARI